jgi:hypothetical protein
MISTRPLPAAILALGLLAAAAPVRAASLAGYGFRSGVASSSVHGNYDEALGSEERIGFAGGLFARYPIGGLFSLQMELGWVSKGDEGAFSVTYATTSGPFAYQTIETRWETRVDYLEIPVLLHLAIPTGTFVEPFALAGPAVGFRTGSSRTVDFASFPATPGPVRIQNANIFEEVGTFDNPQFEDVDWSVIGGGGLKFGRGPIRIVIDSRYTLGLVGILPGQDRSAGYNGSWATTLGIELK